MVYNLKEKDGLIVADTKKILIIDFGFCNFHNAVSLVEEGHKVYMHNVIPVNAVPYNYLTSLGIEVVTFNRDSEFDKWITETEIDIIYNSNPYMPFVFEDYYGQDGIEVLGLSSKACTLELNKFEQRTFLERMGQNLPKLLETPVVPFVYKPKVCAKGNDHARIYLTEEDVDKHWKDRYLHVGYIEEYIPDCIEVNVAYCISGGKWSILHVQEVIGEDICKMASGLTHWTKRAEFDELSDENLASTLYNAQEILSLMSTQDSVSSYVGQITGLIDPNGKWFFCENNVRPEQSNSLPYFMSGNDWLEAMRSGRPDLIGNAFPKDVHKMVVQPTYPDAIYPFHLHEEFNVPIPCGLDIIDDEYRVATTHRSRSVDQMIGIIICGEVIPDGFIDGFEDSEFSISHVFRPEPDDWSPYLSYLR